MLTGLPVQPGLVFASFLYLEARHTEEDLVGLWTRQFGKAFVFYPELNPLIDYYSKEMGPPGALRRFFCLSTTLFPREALLSSKVQALKWEHQFAPHHRRTANIDTGFLSLENFLLATTKNYSHRVYLGEGLFADLTYQFKHGRFEPLPWTYPDYQDEQKLGFFHWGRNFLLNELARSSS